jgi:outer membrane receptor for ferrienterochelin and colicins
MRRRSTVAVLLYFACAVPASAQRLDLGQVPIEELMGLGVASVFGASDRLQPITEVPSSVSIVTADEISRYGYRTLAEILRGVRGFYVTDDRNYSYVGARGFNRPGDYSTRVLLLVNGHRVNDNVFDQASVGADFGIDPAMFERVEIIRGPASSLYGTNALFAIVNVVTRTGASLNGAAFGVDAGTLGTQLVRASAGRRLENGMDVALAGTYERSSGIGLLYVPAFDVPGGNGGVAEHLDGEQSGQIYGRLSVNNLTVTGVFGRRVKDVPTASFFTLFNAQDPVQSTADLKSTVSAEYVRVLGAARLTSEASVDHFRYDGVYPYANEDPQGPSVNFTDGSSGLRWTLSSRMTRPLPGRQTLTLGAEFVDNVDQNQWGAYSFPSDSNFIVDQSSRQGAVYAQDEIRLRPWLLVHGGLRYDRYSRFSRITPRGAIIAMPSGNHSLKYLYGRAFRAPNAYELYYYRDASAYLQPESIHTHEWVWEGYFGERVRTAVSTYRYQASQLVDLRIVDPDVPLDPLGFENAGTIRATGLELESEVRLKRGAQALASYTLQEANDESSGGHGLTNSPRHMAKLRLSVPGAWTRSFASFEWQYLSTRTTLAGATVDPASVAHLTVNLPMGPSVTLSGQIRNLFDARYADPASDEHTVDSIEQNGRTFRIGVRWAFWNPQ